MISIVFIYVLELHVTGGVCAKSRSKQCVPTYFLGMFHKGGARLDGRRTIECPRYDHDHVGNRAERVKIVECYGRSKVMLQPGRRPRPPSEHGLAGGLLLGTTNQSSAQTLSSSGDL
jgi:hypothetical protein